MAARRRRPANSHDSAVGLKIFLTFLTASRQDSKDKTVSKGLTDKCKTAKNLADSRKN